MLISFIENFDRKRTRKKEKIDERRIIIKIEKRWLDVKFIDSSFSVADVPVLALLSEYRTIKDKPEIIAFMLPKSIRKRFLFISSIIEEPITADCPLPKDGRKANNGAERIEAIPVRKKSPWLGLIFFMLNIFCFGSLVFFIMLVIKEEEPNKPESRGNKELLKVRLKLAIPRKPERKKIIRARVFEFFSLKIKKKETKIRIRNISGLMYK